MSQATIKIRQAFEKEHGPQTETLYLEGLEFLGQYENTLLENDISPLIPIHFKHWLASSTEILSKKRFQLNFDNENITHALHPERIGSIRNPSLLAVQKLWKENDILYEAYGAAWALSVFLSAIEVEFSDSLERSNSLSLLNRAKIALERCQPESFTANVLTANGIEGLQHEIIEMKTMLDNALGILRELKDALS